MKATIRPSVRSQGVGRARRSQDRTDAPIIWIVPKSLHVIGLQFSVREIINYKLSISGSYTQYIKIGTYKREKIHLFLFFNEV